MAALRGRGLRQGLRHDSGITDRYSLASALGTDTLRAGR
jgi:hypothetical protein